MKNTDPPNKFKKLNPELARFIESMGMYFESSGIPRIGGRVLGLLMIAHEPLSADDIAQILKVSRASLSTNLRTLTVSGLIEKTSILHDRNTYYVFSDSSLEQRMQVGIQSALVFKKVTAQGLAALSASDSARVRMKKSMEWSDLMAGYMEQALAEWHKRYPDLSHKKKE